MDFKNSCPRSQNRGCRWLGLTVMVLAMMLTILLPGCGSSGSTGGNPVAKAFQDVIFHFNNTEADAKLAAKAVPDGTASVVFTGSDDNRQISYGPVNKPFANTIVLTDVPVATTGFVLEYLDASGSLIGLYSVKPLNMSPYRETDVYVNDYPSITETLSSIKVVPDTITDLAVGYDETLTVTAVFNDGQILNVSKYMTYVTSDENVATVTNSVLTAIGGGSCVISGSLLGMASNDVNVTVNGGVVATSLTVSSESLNIPAEHSRTLQAIVHFNNGTSKVISDGVWTAEPASGVVTLSTSGKVCEVTAVGEVGKTAVVTATTADGALSASCKVTIIDGTLKSLAIERVDEPYEGLTENQIYSYGDGSTAQFKATATYTDGTEEDVTTSVTWNSSNTTAAKFVEATPGLLQGVTENSSTDVTAVLDDETSNSITIETVYPGITEIKINVDSERILIYKGETYNLTVTAYYSNGTSEDITVADDTHYAYYTGAGVESDEFISFSKDTSTNTAVLTGIEVTNTATGYIRVTNDRAGKDVYGSKTAIVTEDSIKSVTINLTDNIGKSWSFDLSKENTIRVPIGRNYTFSIEGTTSKGVSGDITGQCEFLAYGSNTKVETDEQGNVNIVSNEVLRPDNLDQSDAKGTLPDDFEYSFIGRADGVGRINCVAPTALTEDYAWSDDSANALPTAIKPREDDPEGATDVPLVDNGKLDIRVNYKPGGGNIFSLSFILAKPAIDAYYFRNDYSSLYFGDFIYYRATQIPQGTEFDQPIYVAYSNTQPDPEAKIPLDVGDDKHFEQRDDILPNVDSYNKLTFMEKISAPTDNMVSKDYSCPTPFGTDEDCTFDCEEASEDADFGLHLNDGSWQSYHADCELTLYLAPPNIVDAEFVLTDMDGNDLVPDENGVYIVEAGSNFIMKYRNAVLSNNDPFEGDPERNIYSKIVYTRIKDGTKTPIILETEDEENEPFKVHVLETDIGGSNTAAISPDITKYSNAKYWSSKNVKTFKSKAAE